MRAILELNAHISPSIPDLTHLPGFHINHKSTQSRQGDAPQAALVYAVNRTRLGATGGCKISNGLDNSFREIDRCAKRYSRLSSQRQHR